MDQPRTKLVCTIGPASVGRVRELIDAGMDVARINFSHGTPEDQRAAIQAVRAAAREARRTVAVMADLPGPKIRLGELEGHRLELQTSTRFVLRAPQTPTGPGATPDEPTTLGEPTSPEQPITPTGTVSPGEPTTTDQEPTTAEEEPATPQEPLTPNEEPTTAHEPTTPQESSWSSGMASTGKPTASTEPTWAERPPTIDEPTPTGQPTSTGESPTNSVPTANSVPATPPEAASPAEVATAPPDDSGSDVSGHVQIATDAETRKPGDATGATVSHPNLAADLQPGDKILLADGAAELRVIGAHGSDVMTEVIRGGIIRTRSGVNVPSERLTGPALTEQDLEAVPRALELRADLIAQSFVRTAEDVHALRALLPPDGPPIVAKIETRLAVDNFEEIVAACDGVMVARGDLGVDLPFEEVPLVQKRLIRAAQQAGAFSIVATQMLESMTAAPRPTRAEVSDVANAVLDGADAVMLSAETAIGDYPVEAIAAMAAICAATERDGAADLARHPRQAPESDPEAIVHAAVALTDAYPNTSAIWCFTRSGRTAEMLSVMRPKLPIVAFTPGPVTARRLCVRNAVVPVVLHARPTGEPLIKRMETAARAQGQIGRPNGADGARSVLLVTTTPEPGGVNRLELHQVDAGPNQTSG